MDLTRLLTSTFWLAALGLLVVWASRWASRIAARAAV